ncbi:hypothetical protein RAS1_05700 [Phycisphaerae bacterium RAS1]|nr:hypothetical protein RAS1_05700 [Phycisphaerae bacterium RAS1]
MGRFTYYAPLWLGTIVGIILMWGSHELHGGGEPMSHKLKAAVNGLLIGCLCQTIMLALQGTFAQVLPVPGGRSIRGQTAVVSGTMLLVAVGLGLVAGLLVYEKVDTGARIAGGSAGAALLVAIIAYLWGLPLAQRDFEDERAIT